MERYAVTSFELEAERRRELLARPARTDDSPAAGRAFRAGSPEASPRKAFGAGLFRVVLGRAGDRA